MARETPAHRQRRRPSGRQVALLQVVALGVAAALAAVTSGSDRWDAWSLGVIALLTVGSDLTYVETGSAKLKVSGSFLGIILAAVLLGGGPAALIGVLSIAIGWFRSREAGHYLRNNLATYAWFPLLSGLFFHAATATAHIGPHEISYYLLVFATFALALALNFGAIAGYQCYIDSSSLSQKALEALAPLLSAELFSGLLAMASVYIGVQLGVTGLGLFGLVLIVFQYLVGQLLVSKQRSHDLQRMATTDELTGLANRERFRVRVDQRIEAIVGADKSLRVMLIDLDRFKEINDTLGHHYGDLLLRDLGPRLAACVGPGGLVARLGGDEFAVLPAIETDDPAALDELASQLLACIKHPFVADEVTLEVGASIGVSRFPQDGRDAHSLLRCADIAMYAAKESQSGWRLYNADQDRHSLQRLSMLGDLRRGLSLDEIVVHYQPVVDLADMSVCGAEALVRWRHPSRGLLAPGAFIPAVEQTELIGPLTRHVLKHAIAQGAAWHRAGHGLCISVNLSVRNLLDRTLPADLERMLSAAGLPPQLLRLEITESMIMSDPERALATVTRLTDLGVRLSVDDFGTGHSSLANLRRLPIDELKIDRSFVTPMLDEESDLVIVRSTVNLAHDLGLTVVAEGVEDGPTLERLALFGCDLIQGYHVSRPMAPEAFADWIVSTPWVAGVGEAVVPVVPLVPLAA
jgi:diguanylate cyclase (GGDEF)-like protein